MTSNEQAALKAGASGGMRFTRLLLTLLLAILATSAAAQRLVTTDDALAPRIGVITMTPGEEYWARFGHNAIVVDDPVSGRRLSYNYGYFDFDQPDFFLRFLRGQMLYRLAVMPLDEDLRIYANEGRGAQVQWLGLAPEQARAVAQYLEWNARPENADYHYDYFTDNCSTRVRDVLDRALDGGLAQQLSGRSRGLTYRAEVLRLGAGVWWLYLGMHVGLSDFADRPLSLWDEAFVPQRLAEALDRLSASDGTPLVTARAELLADRLGLERLEPLRLRWMFAGIGLGLALVLSFFLREAANRYQRWTGAAVAGGFWLVCGFGGLILASLWAFTGHVAAYANENLLLLNPLCLALLPVLPALVRNTAVAQKWRVIAILLLISAAMALFLRFLPFRLQHTGDFIVLLGPAHAALVNHRAARSSVSRGTVGIGHVRVRETPVVGDRSKVRWRVFHVARCA